MENKFRQDILKLLPCDFPIRKYYEIYNIYGDSCLLTGEKGATIEHFIPLSWGRGGNVWGNLFPISKKLNLSKGNKNIFDWILLDKIAPQIDWFKWEKFIQLVADENMMTINDLYSYTYWCERNKRKIDELIITENRSSIELWRIRNRATWKSKNTNPLRFVYDKKK